MSSISRLLALANICIDLDLGSKKRLFEEVGSLLETSCSIKKSLVSDSLMTREKLGSTGLGYGVAIPHGRIKGLKSAIGVFVKMKKPLPFDAPDGNPVNLIFALLVPEKATDEHLQILGELAQLFSDKDFRQALLSVPNAQAAFDLFDHWQPHV